jgi:putative NADH-flavin reductase
MKVLVLGATGGIGIAFISQLLTVGHGVVVYARSPEKLPDEIRNDARVEIIQGTLSDADGLLKALSKVNAVISALGPSVKKGPFHPGDTPLAKAYALLIEQMLKTSVRRLIALGEWLRQLRCSVPMIYHKELQVIRMKMIDFLMNSLRWSMGCGCLPATPTKT